MKLRTLALITVGVVMPATVFAWPWSTDMMNQPSIKPQEGPPASFAQRSVPVAGIPTMIKDRQAAENLKNPIPVSAKSLKTGKNLFRIYCAACHGLNGQADSPVTPKIGAISLVDDYVQKTLTEGWVYGTITLGSAIMPAYGNPNSREDKRGSNDLSVEERWHVVNYVKNQLAKDAAGSATASAQ